MGKHETISRVQVLRMGHIIKNVCVLHCPVISNVVMDLIYSVNVSEVLVQCLSVRTCIRSAICNFFFG